MSQARYIKTKQGARITATQLWKRLQLSQLSRKMHYSLAAFTTVALVLVVSLPSKEVSAKRHEEKITLSFQDESSQALPPLTETKAEDQHQDLATDKTTTALVWKKQTVKSGDNLSTLFQRTNLSPRDVHLLMSSTPLAKPLLDMRPGQALQFGLDQQGELAQLKYIRTKLESYLYTRTTDTDGSGYTGEHIVLKPDVMMAYREAIIEDSLFLAGERAQLPHNLIMELANIFGWDVDFALDIRKGDRFSLIYEEKFLRGEKIGNGNILAAEFTNRGTTFRAVRYEDSQGNANYYTPEGLSMRKAFLRAPLDFTRISSGFNLRRKHPIHKKIRAHRGVDYAAPRGTPIFAAGDGKVIASSYSKANGNYVFIQHGQRFTTKYLHLQKRKVKKGQQVKQRQVIGTLGSTGYATGPHLHYEFLVNGVHRNPRTVQLPQAKPVNRQERDRFAQQTSPLMMQLASYQQNTQLALASPNQPSSNN
jgi:murein DD-endopeptidase MepM/ murein hydrolase activator NlpD